MKKKIIIFGGTGLFGLNFVNYFQNKYKIIIAYHDKKFFFSNALYEKIDLDNDSELERKLKTISPKIIINACAKTDINWCEKNISTSYKINTLYAEKLAMLSKKINAKFIHISTDQLFSSRNKFKDERETKDPINHYGKTKSAAEDLILTCNKNSLILRTNFFGWSSNLKRNFLELSINKLVDKKKIYVFKDYFYTPIYIGHLLEKLNILIKKKAFGIYNVVGDERVSKYEFFLKISKIFNFNNKLIIPSLLSNKIYFSKRNSDISLNNFKIKKNFNIKFEKLDNQISSFYKDRNLVGKFKKFFYYGKHYLDKTDYKALIKTAKSGYLTQGPTILQAEKIVAKYVGAKFAVAVSSCTAGLHLAAKVLGADVNKNILTSPISFVATSNSAFYCGSKPFFSDVDTQSINLDPTKLSSNYVKKNNIKIIIPVHFGGVPADMEKISNFAKKNNLRIIEDAAHALGSNYTNKKKIGCCLFSDMTVFSFHPVKIIAAGEGGMITTNSKDYYNKLIKYRTHGISQQPKKFLNKKYAYDRKEKNLWFYEMVDLGFHYRQTDLHSSLIVSQMEKIDSFLNKRSEIADIYDKAFSKNPNIEILQKNFRKFSSKHLYIIKINFKKIKKSRNLLMRQLLEHNIQTQVHYIPIPIHPYYKKLGYNLTNLPNSRDYYNSCLSLPIHYNLKKNELDYIIESVNELVS